MAPESASSEEDEQKTCAYVARKDEPSNWHGDEPDDWQLVEDVWECPHEAHDDGELCVFHTPPDELPDDVDEGEEFVRVVNEKSAEAEGERAERLKQFVGADFGEFEIKKETTLNADQSSGGNIHLSHSCFREFIIKQGTIGYGFVAENAVFKKGTVSFAGSKFLGDKVSFRGTEFRNADLVFRGTIFDNQDYVIFDKVLFINKGEVNFGRAIFSNENSVWFRNSIFKNDGGVIFRRAKFNNSSEVRFRGSEFENSGRNTFKGAQFENNGNVWFRQVEFSSEKHTRFARANFDSDGRIAFDNSHFKTMADFINVTINTELSFIETKISSDGIEAIPHPNVNFTKADFTNASLSDADFSENNLQQTAFTRADLYGADFTDARIGGALFGNAQLNYRTNFDILTRMATYAGTSASRTTANPFPSRGGSASSTPSGTTCR